MPKMTLKHMQGKQDKPHILARFLLLKVQNVIIWGEENNRENSFHRWMKNNKYLK